MIWIFITLFIFFITTTFLIFTIFFIIVKIKKDRIILKLYIKWLRFIRLFKRNY